jgi:hypothetical protein
MVEVGDLELVERLEARDGPMAERSVPHSAFGDCRYAETYEGAVCPWCEAEARRREREADAAPASKDAPQA